MTTPAHDSARATLDAFASVGATTCDLTITTRNGRKEDFQRTVPVDRLRSGIAAILDKAAGAEHNVIVRPRGPSVVFIQLDDLTTSVAQRVRDVAFIGLRTSPGNHQAWLAIPPADAGGDLARSLRQAVGADLAASGATRLAGSLNFKDKYAPDFPRVELTFSTAGLIATKEKLAHLGLIAPGDDPPRGQPAPAAHLAHSESPRGSGGYPSRIAVARPAVRKWPHYGRCVEGAPEARAGGRPDISRADFTWCMIAIDWGWSVEETVARLMEQSPKALEQGQRYARLTAQRAAAALHRKR